ncbi:Exopolyphosphatase [hydrothermal vent metagenome]|uniref:Exopolyphosphatase n=1 Tax=hydrothermal vent metagenome TaxID=652676 RepID=A0A3B0Y5G9_9ZZZZ
MSSDAPASPDENLAAVDLGSNSFHLIVASPRNGEFVVVDRIREMVRLADGLDAKRRLGDAAKQRALECLARFGQRVKHLPAENIRVVGTNTLRSAHKAADFLDAAEQALGATIEIISGLEEARLIYLGVAHSVSGDGRRLVMDIGGGSTELIIGEGFKPQDMESLYMGCVSMSRNYFADGIITRKRLHKANLAAQMELEPHVARFKARGWNQAIGASGTIRAVNRVVQAAGWSENGITLTALENLLGALLKAGHVEQLNLDGLGPERTPVFTGGVVVLHATFEALGIKHMQVSDGALREGLLYDMLGRIRHEDVRDRSVAALAKRFGTDEVQAERVTVTTGYALKQVAGEWGLKSKNYSRLLGWAAHLVEIGQDIARNQYHKHGAYIIRHADLLGFGQQEQQLLAALVRAHRRKFPNTLFAELSHGWEKRGRALAVLLRLAVVLHRSRSPRPLPEFSLVASDLSLKLSFPSGWLQEHPLTEADLAQECSYLKAAGFDLSFE